MADWFKFYNDGLDSKGMEFAIGEQPLVTSVWLVILSEASKNRSSTITWDDKDFELIGYARKVNISVPIFNQCVGLLERIGYIVRGDGVIKIPGWESMQSNYAKGVDKGYYKKTNKPLVSDSQVSTPRREESRREEKRVEESTTKSSDAPAAPPPRPQNPSIEMVKLQASKIGISDFEAEKFFDYYESNGWRVGRNPMKSWTHALNNWKKTSQNYGKTNNGTGFNGTKQPIQPVRGSTQVGGF